ncbi:MAG TPA: glycosyltransferase family 4 protein [Gemmatimonadaceae bacterium]|nr:glycosyltransferase family 4 protein [Gemmatimonadaceae bacterium]
MRRIALVCDWYAPRRGGIEAHLEGLARRLSERGNEVHVITSTPGPPSDVAGVTIHRLNVPRLPGFGVALQPVAARIARLLEREKVDVAHSHVSIVAPVALGGALAAHRTGTPGVVTFHSFVPATPLWAAITGRLLGTSAWSATMTAVSARVIREVSSFAPRSRFTILPNAIDTAFWTPLPRTRSSNRVSLVYAGRLNSKKRPLLLVDVVKELKRNVPDLDFRLHVIGSGPLESSLRRRFAAENLLDVVEITGWLDRTSLRDLYASADVFLSTAHRESFGLAALEARAMGVPVVAMRDSAVSDFVRDGESGLLADDDAGFVAAVRRLASDGALRAEIQRNVRADPAPFGWDTTLAMHDSVYAAAIARSGNDGVPHLPAAEHVADPD